jgi:tetratricopeptide (TPR) repeat protein
MTDDLDDLEERERRACEALAEYFEAARAGHAPAREEYLAAHPDLADDLAAFLDDEDRLLHETAAVRSAVGHAAEIPAPEKANGNAQALHIPPMPGFDDFEIEAEIARGGMGVVYRARQRSLGRPVALKLLRGGCLADEEDGRRFRREVEAVAALDHPNIVSIYEVARRDGLPYFAMKLVDGVSLAQRLPDFVAQPRAAARLVATVARAVHHAHQRGVLHRDLKPSNILIDTAGQPHITDFGLAKRVEGDPDLTDSGAIVGTPSYMAPEQATGQRNAVTTAVDVHGLGAVLYALLSGKPPYRGDSVLEILEHVRREPPEPPSSVDRRIDRDLETICLKCLEKEPERRYGSALAVAEDLERWLRGEPIEAVPPSAWSRVRKFVRRNCLAVGLVSLAALSLVAGTAASLLQAARASRAAAIAVNERNHAVEAERRARRDRDAALQAKQQAAEQLDRSQAIAKFFQDFLGHSNVEGQDQRQGRPDPNMTVRTVLDRAAKGLEGWTFGDRPFVEEEIRSKLADNFRLLSLYAQAEAQMKQVVALRRRLFGDNDRQTLMAQNNLGELCRQQGKLVEAESLLRSTLVAQRAALGADDGDVLTAQNNLALVYQDQGKLAEAEPLLRAVYQVRRQTRGPKDPLTILSMSNMASLYQYQGKLAEAEPLLHEVLEFRRGVHAPDHPDVLLSENNLATVYAKQGKVAQAAAMYRRAWESAQRLLGPDHFSTLALQNNLGTLYQRAGNLLEAEPLLRDAFDKARRKHGDRNPVTIKLQKNLAQLDEQMAKAGVTRMPNGLGAFSNDMSPR